MLKSTYSISAALTNILHCFDYGLLSSFFVILENSLHGLVERCCCSEAIDMKIELNGHAGERVAQWWFAAVCSAHHFIRVIQSTVCVCVIEDHSEKSVRFRWCV
jgi:hypothetical protein